MSEKDLKDVLVMKLALDEAYFQYKSDHSMAVTRHIHPMFRNGTFSKDNSYQPPDPGKELTREEFEDLVLKGDSKWDIVTEALVRYMYKER